MLERLGQLLAGEVGGPDRADLSGANELVERVQRLRLGRVRVEVMSEIERDPLEPEPPQADVDLAEDAVAREPVVGTRLVRVEGLGLDHDRVADRAVLRSPATRR